MNRLAIGVGMAVIAGGLVGAVALRGRKPPAPECESSPVWSPARASELRSALSSHGAAPKAVERVDAVLAAQSKAVADAENLACSGPPAPRRTACIARRHHELASVAQALLTHAAEHDAIERIFARRPLQPLSACDSAAEPPSDPKRAEDLAKVTDDLTDLRIDPPVSRERLTTALGGLTDRAKRFEPLGGEVQLLRGELLLRPEDIQRAIAASTASPDLRARGQVALVAVSGDPSAEVMPETLAKNIADALVAIERGARPDLQAEVLEARLRSQQREGRFADAEATTNAIADALAKSPPLAPFSPATPLLPRLDLQLARGDLKAAGDTDTTLAKLVDANEMVPLRAQYSVLHAWLEGERGHPETIDAAKLFPGLDQRGAARLVISLALLTANANDLAGDRVAAQRTTDDALKFLTRLGKSDTVLVARIVAMACRFGAPSVPSLPHDRVAAATLAQGLVKGLADTPVGAELHLSLAEALADAKKLPEARDAIDAGLRVGPLPTTRVLLALLAKRVSHPQAAQIAADTLAALPAEHPLRARLAP